MSHYDELRAYYHSQPGEVSLETQALCNARCTFCPYPTMERKGAKMPDALLEKLLLEMADFKLPFYFSPFKVNEPFLDKRLIPLCRAFNRHVPGSAIRLFSNGSALTDKHIEEVASLKRVAHLWISLNSHIEKDYEEIMGLKFSTTLKRLDSLHEKEDFPFSVVVSRVGPDDAFVRFVEERWPRFQPALIKRDAWIDFTEASTTEVPDTPCGRWWELNITATGKAALCCMDGEGEYGFGDVNKQTLLEIYNHPTLKLWRETFTSRKQSGSPCDRCSY